MRSRKYRGLCGLILAAALFALPSTSQAADYNFETQAPSDYYGSTSYEDIYGSQYNYGGPNVVDYQVPELEYGVLSTTQTGIMEKALLPGLQQTVAAGTGGDGYGIGGGGATVTLPDISNGESFLPALPAYTQLTDDFLLLNGAIGKISIPAIGVKNYYLWEGATNSSMNKGLGHFATTSVWDGNVGLCGHNRGARYIIGAIKDMDVGDKVTYTTSEGTRTYEVETIRKIQSDDWSVLDATADNRITMITCVAGDYSQRWCLQAVEVD